MDNISFTKSFSKGQITIPKVIRDQFGLKDDFWLKLYTENNKIIAEPVSISSKPKNYLSQLSLINGKWFDIKEYKSNRIDIAKRLSKIK